MTISRTPYGSLLEHHLRIGDTEFFVPPTAISVQRQMKNKRVPMLRARNSMVKESGYFDRVIELTLFFPNMRAINTELRPLLAQVKKCPFLPVENTYLNDVHKIEAITISGVTVQTTPGFPHTLQAQVQCYAFEPNAYLAEADDRTYDEMIDWELFRWYYMRNLDPEVGESFHTYYEPLYNDLDNQFMFRIVAEDNLGAINAWKKEKKKLIKDWMRSKREDFWTAETQESDFFEKYNEAYEKAMFEYDLHYETWDIPGLVLTDLSIGFENSISSVQLQHDQSPTHQYLGSQDTILVARFTTDDYESLASLENLLNRSTHLIREHHKDVANGFLEFDHQLARLFGVRNVTIEDVQTNTVEGQPGVYEVSITMIAYNRMEKKLNEAQWLSKDVKWDIDEYENQGVMSLLTSLNPMTWGGEPGEGPSDILRDNFAYRWFKFIADRPAMASQIFSNINEIITGMEIRHESEKIAVYEQAIKEYFRAAEVYPDLELPTYVEVQSAGFDVPNTNNGVFVDPDFFIKYNTDHWFQNDLIKAMKHDYKTTLRDGIGGEAEISGSEVSSMNETTATEIETNEQEFQEATEKTIDESEVPPEVVDESNLTKAQMEALIREKSLENNINQNFPLAFARVMDEEMKHFYEIGTNAKQGRVLNVLSSNPVMMNKNFEFYTNGDGVIDGEYIGVMKTRPMYGVKNLLGKNIEYNVDQGIKFMKKFYDELTDVFAAPATESGTMPLHKEDHVFSHFNIQRGTGSWDEEQARFAGVLMRYLGYEREYMELIQNNKRPPIQVTRIIEKVLFVASDEEEWNTQQINSKTQSLPLKDFKTAGTTATSSSPNMTMDDWEDDNSLHKGMMHDMVNYDKRGRLLRAFPTFFLTFVDEGQYLGAVKLSDQYFNYQAVMDIMYTNSRKEASSTLVLEMSNVYGSLDDAEKQMDLTNTSYREVFKMMTMPGAVAQEAERSRHRHPNYYKSIMLRTGTRIHFRMGYGSNPMSMPVTMNGTITSIQNNGASLTVVAQDDGIELTNKIRADVNDTTDGGFLFSKKEPTEIVDELLTDSNGFFKNLWAGMSNKEFEDHSLGIMHFGRQKPQGMDDFKQIFNLLPVTSWFNGNLLPLGTERTIGEINMNVYRTTGFRNDEQEKWWHRVQDAFGIGAADEPGINIGLFDKTVWDVLNITASIGEDHIVSVHPFGFRNTIFSGKPYFPLHYDYIVEEGAIKGTYIKPFRQFHAYDSVTSIIDNSIKATEENMYTVAVGMFMNEGEMDNTAPIFVDTNIWPEKQRTVNIDTSMNAQGIRLVQNIPLVGNFLNKAPKWYYDEGVAIKITAAGLRDFVKDMYDGYLTVMGDPSVKPYDQAWINDTHNDIKGPADVKEVTQIMNHQVGYITMIKPDAVVVNTDRRILNLMMSAQALAGSALITHSLRKVLSTKHYAGSLPILNSVWSATKWSANRMNQRFKSGKISGRIHDHLTGKIPKDLQKILDQQKARGGGIPLKDIAHWSKNGMLEQMTKLMGEESTNNMKKVFENSKKIPFTQFQKISTNRKAGALIASGNKKIGTILRGGRSLAGGIKAAWSAGHAAAGPVGLIALGIEALAVHIVASTVGEFLERFLFMRQACLISPLQKDGFEWAAGINGHKGSVIGDSPDFWQSFFTNDVSALLLGFIGVDAWQFQAQDQNWASEALDPGKNNWDETMEEVSGMNVSAKSQSTTTSINEGELAKNLFNFYRKPVRDIANLKELYDEDRKAALKHIDRRKELQQQRETSVTYKPEDSTWDEWKDKIGGWFSGLWDKVTDFFGGDDNSSCQGVGNPTASGKAINLSSYFDVLGPKIEAQAKAQGLEQWSELLKAKCMQESGGNYKRYPDVFQASESLGLPVNTIGLEKSIEQGVKYFGQVLSKAQGDIKLALQSYNFGSGFINYVKDRGGKYTKELATQFSTMMAKKMGWKRYGDINYVDNVLRYYQGEVASAECVEGSTGGAESCPSVTGTKGKQKYRLSSNEGNRYLTDLRNVPNPPYRITIVGGSSTSKLRHSTVDVLTNAAKTYRQRTGKTFAVTSGWRPGDPNWHGTGWAVDIDTPNTMVWRSGKLRFPNGKDKQEARTLCECVIQAGFRANIFGDWDIVQEMNNKYGAGTMIYDPKIHHNHLHCSYPICKKE